MSANPLTALCDQDDARVAVVGTPRWRDDLLAGEQQAQGPARALRLAYRRHGLQLFDRIAGPFAFAVLDRLNRRALLAIDRMGVRGLYYAQAGADALVFGTSADMVRAHPGVGATVPLQAVYGYHYAGVCRSPRTIYAEQRKLGPAQYLLWQDGRIQVENYWRIPFRPDRAHIAEELGEELIGQVRRAVRAAISEGRVASTGAFLSGGLDSSTVAGLLNEVTATPADTFTTGFNEASYDEMRYADAVSRTFGTRAHRYYLTPEDTAETAPRVAAYCDEPFGNSSALPAYFRAVQARDAGMTCLLAGDGGDGILAGNSRYLEQATPAAFAAAHTSSRHAEVRRLSRTAAAQRAAGGKGAAPYRTSRDATTRAAGGLQLLSAGAHGRGVRA